MCRGVSGSPTLPWAARLVARAPRRTILARRVPPFEPITLPALPQGFPRCGRLLVKGQTTVPRRLRIPSWPLTPPDFQSRVCEIPRGSRSPR